MKKYLVLFKNEKFQRIEVLEDPYDTHFYDNYLVCKKQVKCVERSIVVDAKSETEAIDLAYHLLYDSCDWIKNMLLDELRQCERAVASMKYNICVTLNNKSKVENIEEYEKRINYLKRLTCGII